ncbi:endonuclease domain-containing protein [Stenotrophomonas humi]
MTHRIKPPLPTVTLERARRLRRNMTETERRLWSRLRGGQLNGLKFRRQHPIPPYIVDFYCEASQLVVELDGSQHNEVADRARTQFLEQQGLVVLRYWDHEVLRQIDAVLEAIVNMAEGRTLTPTPLPSGEGL